MSGEWILNQINTVTFVMVDGTGTEVPGLGAGYTLEVRKVGGAFVGSAGTKTEVSNGWYQYVSTAAEADTIGPLSVRVTGAGAVQQNLEYIVRGRLASCVEWTYTVTDSVTTLPIEGVEVNVTTDVAGINIIWWGVTDALGIARDENDNLPCLDAGTYYFWKSRAGYIDDQNPDTEVVA